MDVRSRIFPSFIAGKTLIVIDFCFPLHVFYNFEFSDLMPDSDEIWRWCECFIYNEALSNIIDDLSKRSEESPFKSSEQPKLKGTRFIKQVDVFRATKRYCLTWMTRYALRTSVTHFWLVIDQYFPRGIAESAMALYGLRRSWIKITKLLFRIAKGQKFLLFCEIYVVNATITFMHCWSAQRGCVFF